MWQRKEDDTTSVGRLCVWIEQERLARHHRLKHALAAMLSEKGLVTVDETYCHDSIGGDRFIDILAFEPSPSRRAYIVDPTIRYETNEQVDEAVQAEKSEIYAPCVPNPAGAIQRKFRREYEVIGVWLGARGTVSRSLLNLFEKFKLDKNRLPQLAEQVIADSVRIIHNHIYS